MDTWVGSDRKQIRRHLRAENPWTKPFVFADGTLQEESSAVQVELAAKTGIRYVLTPNSEMMTEWQTKPILYAENGSPKEKQIRQCLAWQLIEWRRLCKTQFFVHAAECARHGHHLLRAFTN